jgi:hypothetical protein
MNVLIHKKIKTGDGSISFPQQQSWNPVTNVATIAVQVSGERVSCRIKIDDLIKRFKIHSEEPMVSVTNHRPAIENAARKLIGEKDYEKDGSIMIGYKDL